MGDEVINPVVGEPKSKKWIFIVIGVVVVIIIGVIVGVFFMVSGRGKNIYDNSNFEGSTVEECEEDPTCLSSVAETNLDVELCKQSIPNMCLNKIAIASDNMTICNEWNNISESQADSCFKNFALNSGNADACYFVRDDWRDACFLDVAKLIGDGSLCDEITADYSLKPCLWHFAILEGDVEYCERIPIADYLKEPDYVQTVRGVNLQDNCLLHVAVVNEDVAICGQISGVLSRETCNENIPKVIDKDSEICGSFVRDLEESMVFDFC